LIPLPSKWRIEFHPPVHVETYTPDAAEDRNLVMAIADEVRETIQKGVYENLKRRRSVFT
jgi:hypothetical protein